MKDIQFLKNNLIAHRGIHYNYRENTLKAFREAMLKKYIIELDVHLTKDNIVVVFHDNNLKRLTGINKNIKDLTYDEIKNIIDVPTLNEVLSLVKGKVPIIIELKFDNKVGKLEKVVSNILDKYDGKFAIQSFNPLSIFWFKLNRNNYIRGYLINSIFPDNFLVKYIFKSRILNIILTPDYIGVNLSLLTDKKTIKLRDKYFIIGYTINNKDEYNKYKEYADNFICNIGKEPINKALDR